MLSGVAELWLFVCPENPKVYGLLSRVLCWHHIFDKAFLLLSKNYFLCIKINNRRGFNVVVCQSRCSFWRTLYFFESYLLHPGRWQPENSHVIDAAHYMFSGDLKSLLQKFFWNCCNFVEHWDDCHTPISVIEILAKYICKDSKRDTFWIFSVFCRSNVYSWNRSFFLHHLTVII